MTEAAHQSALAFPGQASAMKCHPKNGDRIAAYAHLRPYQEELTVHASGEGLGFQLEPSLVFFEELAKFVSGVEQANPLLVI